MTERKKIPMVDIVNAEKKALADASEIQIEMVANSPAQTKLFAVAPDGTRTPLRCVTKIDGLVSTSMVTVTFVEPQEGSYVIT